MNPHRLHSLADCCRTWSAHTYRSPCQLALPEVLDRELDLCLDDPPPSGLPAVLAALVTLGFFVVLGAYAGYWVWVLLELGRAW